MGKQANGYSTISTWLVLYFYSLLALLSLYPSLFCLSPLLSVCICSVLTPEEKQKRQGMDVDIVLENSEGGLASYDSDDDDLNTSSDSDEEK